jgi:hypothetical protein
LISSAIIEDITALYEAGLASMAYFCFNFQDISKQTRRDLLHSLLIQRSAHSNPFATYFPTSMKRPTTVCSSQVTSL